MATGKYFRVEFPFFFSVGKIKNMVSRSLGRRRYCGLALFVDYGTAVFVFSEYRKIYEASGGINIETNFQGVSVTKRLRKPEGKYAAGKLIIPV